MLVGAGGNAGNQSAIRVIRGLATGRLRSTSADAASELRREAAVALVLGGALALGGFARVYATQGSVVDAVAISAALMCIVVASVVLGTALPFGLARLGADPANAGTSIQVVMDVLGVATTCVVVTAVLDNPWVVSALEGVGGGLG